MGKLINNIPGLRLLISGLPGSALRTHVESLGKPRDVNKLSQSLPSKLDIKIHSPSILYLAEACTEKLANLLSNITPSNHSKDLQITHSYG